MGTGFRGRSSRHLHGLPDGAADGQGTGSFHASVAGTSEYGVEFAAAVPEAIVQRRPDALLPGTDLPRRLVPVLRDSSFGIR